MNRWKPPDEPSLREAYTLAQRASAALPELKVPVPLLAERLYRQAVREYHREHVQYTLKR